MKRGYSLVEMIIYVALLALFLGVIVSVLLGVGRSLNYVQATIDSQQSAITALDRVVREIQNAQSVNTGTSVFNTSPGTLTLTTTNDADDAITRSMYINNGVVRMKENSVDVGALTSSNVVVSQLEFNFIDGVVSDAVRVTMTVDAGKSSSARSDTYYATAIVRGSIKQ